MADIGPQLVAFDPVRANADHHAVVQFGAATTDLKGELADRLAIDAGNAGNGADAEAFGQGGDDFNLLFAGEDIHGGPNPSSGDGPKRDSGKTA